MITTLTHRAHSVNLRRYADSKRVQAHTRAFLVLAHAEIETYLEVWAKDIARAAQTVWSRSKRVTAPLAFLISSIGDRITVVERLSASPLNDSHQRFEELVGKLFQDYFKRIKYNNGVKEKNVLSLFEPLGVPSSAFGTTLLPSLDTLGSIRGLTPIRPQVAVVSVLDAETEYNRIQNLLTDLVVFDTWQTGYKRRIR